MEIIASFVNSNNHNANKLISPKTKCINNKLGFFNIFKQFWWKTISDLTVKKSENLVVII